MNNRRQIKIRPLQLQAWTPSGMRLNNMALNKSQAFTFSLDENRVFRLRLFPGDKSRQPLYAINMTLGIGDTTAGLWLSDWPLLDNIREYIPEAMLPRLPENLGIALAENALEPLINIAEHGLASKIKLQSLSAQQNSPVYTLPLGFELLEANRGKPDPNSTHAVHGLLMLEGQLYPMLQQRLRLWPSDLNEAWENLETSVFLEIGQLALTIPEINSLGSSDVLLLENNRFREEGTIRLRVNHNLYCEAEISSGDANKILTIATGWTTMADHDAPNSIDQLNKLPVKLSFDLGQKTISFSEIKQLRPGYVIDLPHSLPEVVQIHAQNKQIGTGELVEISGRIGIRIISLFGTRPSN
ncbi:MAG: FliM/FliN family flagellar motor switch protein [Thiothrix sp.]|nr:FliM/FliN family flagellar motor switch protein [Thiothrix sp.]